MCRPAQPQVARHVTGERQRDEGIVLDRSARSAAVKLGIDGLRRSEEDHRLVDAVAAEIDEHAAASHRVRPLLPRRWVERLVTLEARLEAHRGAQAALRKDLAEGQEVAVPTPVLEHGQGHTRRGGQANDPLRRRGRCREWLVDDHGDARADGLLDELGVGTARRRDDDEIELAAPPAPTSARTIAAGYAARAWRCRADRVVTMAPSSSPVVDVISGA